MFKKISHPVHKVYHFLGGLFFPAVYYFLPSKKIVLIVFLALAIIFSLIEVLRFSSSRAKKVMGQKLGKASILFKKEEGYRISGTTYLTWGVFFTTLFFQKDIAVLAMIFVALGDVAAAVFGEAFGKTNIFGRSLEGFLAGFIVSLLACLIYLNYFSFVGLNFRIILLGALTASIIGHLSAPLLKINDNLTIPLISGLVMTLL